MKAQHVSPLSTLPFGRVISLSLEYWLGSPLYLLVVEADKKMGRQEESLERPLLGLGGLVASGWLTGQMAVFHLLAEILPL